MSDSKTPGAECSGSRVTFYAGGFAPLGGIETFTRNLTVAVADAGYEASLACWGRPSELLDEIAQAGVAIRRQSFRKGCRFGLPDLLLLARTWRHLRSADVVFLGKLPPLIARTLLDWITRSGRRIPCVYVTPYRPAEMWSDRVPSLRHLRFLDTIVVQAECFADDLRSFGYNGPIEVVPYLPVSQGPVAQMPEAKGVIRIGFLGRLVPQKNLPYLFCALRKLIDTTDREYELHLFGDGVDYPALRSEAGREYLAEQVYFHGAVEHAGVPAAIDSCHLFAFSSVSEGQCLAALEILGRGRPVVGTPVGALPDLIGNNQLGRIAPLDDADAFAEALDTVATDITEGRVSAESVREAYDCRFSHDVIRSRYLALIERVTSRARRLV